MWSVNDVRVERSVNGARGAERLLKQENNIYYMQGLWFINKLLRWHTWHTWPTYFTHLRIYVYFYFVLNKNTSLFPPQIPIRCGRCGRCGSATNILYIFIYPLGNW